MPVDRPAEERLRRRHRDGEVAAAGQYDQLGAALARELLPLRLAEDDGRARLDDRQLLGRDGLTRRAEDVGVLERDVGQHLHG